MIERRQIAVSGVVQGIGFRPFVYKLAYAQALTGHVLNGAGGVMIEIQGGSDSLDRFEDHLVSQLPPGGRIERCQTHKMEVLPSDSDFIIKASSEVDGASISLAPDRFVCPDCQREMRDPNDRRYRYPFINCTCCGPRYTITSSLPYDRSTTTMAEFEMCLECKKEYTDPTTRRYHAQPIACPECGPTLRLVSHQNRADNQQALQKTAQLLSDGKIVAIKGIGGFHLAVDARNEAAVSRLRRLKKRPTKPLAVMARDLDVARQLVCLTEKAEALLLSPAAPIVLAEIRTDCSVATWIAPGLNLLGVMLPYTPLHHLLCDKGPLLLVMTSGNRNAEPITIDDEDAASHLDVDAYLVHNRKIHVACDDSVIRCSGEGLPVFIRRSRGYVPEAIDAAFLPKKSILALGALLKVTVATLDQGQLVVGRHLGDLNNTRAEGAFREEVNRMLVFGRVEPEAVAVDAHPDSASGLFAEDRFSDLPLLSIQHHHAHLAAVMVEHALGLEDQVIGIILDGFGYGLDGAIWGGELLLGSFSRFERKGHLRYIPQPGGDLGAVQPRRMATSLLADAGIGSDDVPVFDRRIADICGIGSVSPLTSSAGRLFDGVAAMLGVAPKLQTYEGEAAAKLEAVADPFCDDAYPLPVLGDTLDSRVLVRALMADQSATPLRAARFHNGLADGFSKMAIDLGPARVVLGGGCMVNHLLLRRLKSKLEAAGMQVLTARRLPPGDGAISAGQAAIAACSPYQGGCV
ncbi:MAG: carbamoyltransferase HypF [Myxococcota bacterium]|nr:carbamoyltransferase HypF [Myxococcota bacterium]